MGYIECQLHIQFDIFYNWAIPKLLLILLNKYTFDRMYFVNNVSITQVVIFKENLYVTNIYRIYKYYDT